MNQPNQPPSVSPTWILVLGLLLGISLLVFMAWDSFSSGKGKQSASAHVIELTEANWQKEVVESDIPVVVDFWAEWCGPCHALAPTIDKIADRYAGKVKVGKVDLDTNKKLVQKYDIDSIPRVLIFKGGEEPRMSFVGVQSEAKYAGAIDALLAQR